MTLKPAVVVVIVAYNASNDILECVNSLLKTDYTNFKVVVVDNASTDETQDILTSLKDVSNRLEIVRLSKNLGYTGGNNLGYSLHQNAEYITFLNPDTILTTEWLSPIIDLMERKPLLAAVQPKILKPDGKIIDSCGNDIDRLGFGLQYEGYSDSSQFDKPRSIFYADGAAIVLRTSACKAIQFQEQILDDSYFMTYEEVDLCWRLRLAGFEIFYFPKSVIYHKRSFSALRVPSSMEIYRRTLNKLSTLYKNYNLRNSMLFIPLSLSFDLLGILFLSIRSKTLLTAYFQAILFFSKRIRTSEQFRQFIQSTRKIEDRELKHHMAVINPFRTLRSVLREK